MEMNLIINPEFQNKIPPLTDEEFRHLEELILADGRVNDPIKVWNRIIVDGHHRWKIIQKHPEIPYKVQEMDFADKWEAFGWMFNNQLGRRNLTEDQYRYLLGKYYEASKHTHGAEKGGRGNQYTKVVSSQDGNLPNTARAAERIAAEKHVSKNKVIRAGQYARGIDAIREIEPETADKILTGEKKVGQKEIREIGKADPENVAEMVDELLNGKPARKQTSRPWNEGGSMENRRLSREVREIIGGMEDDGSVMEYTIDNLTEQIGFNADSFIGVLSNLIMDHSDLCDGNRETVIKAIDGIVAKIEKIKERLNDGTQL